MHCSNQETLCSILLPYHPYGRGMTIPTYRETNWTYIRETHCTHSIETVFPHLVLRLASSHSSSSLSEIYLTQHAVFLPAVARQMSCVLQKASLCIAAGGVEEISPYRTMKTRIKKDFVAV